MRERVASREAGNDVGKPWIESEIMGSIMEEVGTDMRD